MADPTNPEEHIPSHDLLIAQGQHAMNPGGKTYKQLQEEHEAEWSVGVPEYVKKKGHKISMVQLLPKKPVGTPITVTCPYCKKPAQLVGAQKVYGPNISGALAGKKFWQCKPCDAHVGTHPGLDTPLGTLANGPLRMYRQQVHSLLDPIWKNKGLIPGPPKHRRLRVYKFLSDAMDLPIKDTHIALFNDEQCIEACKCLEVIHAILLAKSPLE